MQSLGSGGCISGRNVVKTGRAAARYGRHESPGIVETSHLGGDRDCRGLQGGLEIDSRLDRGGE